MEIKESESRDFCLKKKIFYEQMQLSTVCFLKDGSGVLNLDKGLESQTYPMRSNQSTNFLKVRGGD